MAGAVALSTATALLLTLFSSFDLVFSGVGPIGPRSFVINGESYPAAPTYTALYVVSDSDGDTLNIDCVHGVDVSTADWELVTSEFDGEPQPSPGPAPSVSQSLLVDTPEALTEWFADGTVLTFTSLSPQLEGIYRCGVGNMRIRLTYDNPYVVTTDRDIFTTLTDTLSVRAITRYADPEAGRNQNPPLVLVTATAIPFSEIEISTELTILSASESTSDPYETIYEVARPGDFVEGEIRLIVDLQGGMIASDFVTLFIEDIYEGLMLITVVEQGEEVVFNCTPTAAGINATFSGGEALTLFPPVGNVWRFPATTLEYTGIYSCSVQFESRLTQRTSLVVYPSALESDVAFYDVRNDVILPDAYILLNYFTREGLNFACISRTGPVSLFSNNATITDLYAAVDSVSSFEVGSDSITVTRGDRFLDVDMSTMSSYGDTLLCKTQDFTESVSLQIVPDSAYIVVQGPTSAVIDYGQYLNISFIFDSATGLGMELLLNGSQISNSPEIDPDNNLILSYLVQGLSNTGGVYTLRRNADERTPNANFSLTVTFPVLTVSVESLTVMEGENFTLSCTSSIPSLFVEWSPATVGRDTSNIVFDGPTVTVVNATRGNEGIYSCEIREMGEAIIASSSVEVDVLITCPENYAGGILWPSTLENQLRFADCRDADSRFSAAVQVYRLCSPFGWLVPNFSGCTLASNEPQMFVIFSLHYTLSRGTRQDVADNIDAIKSKLNTTSTSFLSAPLLSTELLIVPGVFPVNSTLNGVRFRFTINFNTSAQGDLVDIDSSLEIADLSDFLHCDEDILIDTEDPPYVLGVVSEYDENGDTVGFVRSDICECVPSWPFSPILVPTDGRLERKRQLGPFEGCVLFFADFQNMCSGTTAPPCNCFSPEGCQCETLYVGDGTFCTLDQDGDSYPATVLSVICEEGENTSYCRQDLCPDVPNTDPSSDTVCRGFSQSSGVEFCVGEFDDVWEIQWPFIEAGTTATVPCGVNYTGDSTRECVRDRMWAEPDVSNCSSRVITTIRFRIALLVGEGDVEGALEVVDELADATSEPLFPSDVNTAIDDIDDVLSLLEDDNVVLDDVVNQASSIFRVLDNLLVDGNAESFEILEQVGAAQRVLDNVERYALYVAQVLQEEGGDFVTNTTGENIVLRAASLSLANLGEEYVFPDPKETVGVVFPNSSSASISLPQELLVSRGIGGSVGVASVLFRNLQSFLPNNSETTHPRSLVISSQVAEEGGNGEIDEVLRDNPVLITFSFEAEEDEEIPFGDIRCVFWNFGDDDSSMDLQSDAVRWSTAGLRTESVTRDGNTVTVVCSSTHLTSFAVLVDVGGARLESEALRIVSYIGLAISLACLLLTIIFFLTFGKKLFTAVHNFVHLNLAIALFIGYLVFAVGVELANHEKIPCNVVTALIQYFLLAAFCWMMCEGIMLYLMLVVVFTTLSKKWWFFLLLGWGIPVLFVAAGLGPLHEEYGVKDDSLNNDDYYKYCWLSSGNGTYAIWLFVGPMLGIILINTVFLVMVLWSVLKSRANRQKKLDSGYRVDVALSVVKASLILLPLLGLTWVFGLFAVNENTAVFAWLFTIFNTLQGLFIFIFHVIRNDRIWGRLKKKYTTYSTTRSSKSTDSTGLKSKYHSVASSSTAGVELKEHSMVDPGVKTDLGNDPQPTTKEEPA